MRNPCRKLTGWWNREGERAKAKGGLQLFWFALTNGLLWTLFMVTALGLFDYFDGGKSFIEGMRRHFLMYFVIGMLTGLSSWKRMSKPGNGSRP